MDTSKLQESLNNLWGGIVSDFQINILNHLITIKLKTLIDDNTNDFLVMFEGVSSFYFIEHEGVERFDPPYEQGDFTEVTSITYYPTGVGDIDVNNAIENWIDQYQSSANFGLEL